MKHHVLQFSRGMRVTLEIAGILALLAALGFGPDAGQPPNPIPPPGAKRPV